MEITPVAIFGFGLMAWLAFTHGRGISVDYDAPLSRPQKAVIIGGILLVAVQVIPQWVELLAH